jgi:hypothetical protein
MSKVSKSKGTELMAEHPFTILGYDDENKLYQVRYGWASRQQGYSPHAEVAWQSSSDMQIMGISPGSIEAADIAWKSGIHPNPIAAPPVMTDRKRQKKKGTKQQGKKGECS